MLSAAREAIKASLAALDPDARFQVVAYNGAAEAFGREMVPATPENVSRAAAWLDGRWAEGGSIHVAGFKEGVWLRPDVVFLLTDADDLDERDVRVIAGLARRQVRLNVAIFGDRRSARETPLGRLVRELGGTVQFVGPN
jgi:hypothetical protein